MGKGGGGPGAAAHMGEQMSLSLMQQGSKSRKAVFKQLTEGLKTGNIEARRPIIQSMVEQGLQTGSQGIKKAEEQVYQSGAGRTPYAQETMAGGRTAIQRAVHSIPSDVVGQTVMGGAETLQNSANAALGLMGVAQQARSGAATADAAKAAGTNSAIGGGVAAAASIATAVAAIV